MEYLHEILKDNLEASKTGYKRISDAHRREGEKIQVGDQVWLSSKGLPFKGRRMKLEPRRLGPFKGVQEINLVSFRLRFFAVPLYSSTQVPGGEEGTSTPPKLVEGEQEYKDGF